MSFTATTAQDPSLHVRFGVEDKLSVVYPFSLWVIFALGMANVMSHGAPT